MELDWSDYAARAAIVLVVGLILIGLGRAWADSQKRAQDISYPVGTFAVACAGSAPSTMRCVILNTRTGEYKLVSW